MAEESHRMRDVRGADSALLAVLGTIAERGAIGETSLEAAVAHADQFVAALPGECERLADLGSGGGLPGLVIAVRRPDLKITLVERRATRADMLARAVRALEVGEWVQVLSADVAVLAANAPASFDVVTARSFAAPPITARWAGVLLRPGGMLIVSEPPTDDPTRWTRELLERTDLTDLGRLSGIRRFQRH